MELTTIQIGMFEMLAIVILAIYLGQWNVYAGRNHCTIYLR